MCGGLGMETSLSSGPDGPGPRALAPSRSAAGTDSSSPSSCQQTRPPQGPSCPQSQLPGLGGGSRGRSSRSHSALPRKPQPHQTAFNFCVNLIQNKFQCRESGCEINPPSTRVLADLPAKHAGHGAADTTRGWALSVGSTVSRGPDTPRRKQGPRAMASKAGGWPRGNNGPSTPVSLTAVTSVSWESTGPRHSRAPLPALSRTGCVHAAVANLQIECFWGAPGSGWASSGVSRRTQDSATPSNIQRTRPDVCESNPKPSKALEPRPSKPPGTPGPANPLGSQALEAAGQ